MSLGMLFARNKTNIGLMPMVANCARQETWIVVKRLTVDQRYDQPSTYLKPMLDHIGK
jgi:hypothetical protein